MTTLSFGLTLGGEHLDLAPVAEDLGYASLWTGGHIVFYGPMLEPLTQMAMLAARTRRVRVGTNVVVLPLWHPTIVAKVVSTVDVISGGRVTLGVGVGGEYAREFEAVGVPVRERGARTDEAIGVMKALWTGEQVSHRGRFYALDEVRMQPTPAQRPHPPIWVGGRSEAAARRAGRLGNGYVPYMVDPAQYRERISQAQAAAQEAGRDPAAVEPALFVFTCLADRAEDARDAAARRLSAMYNQPFERLVDRYCILGTPSDCIRRVEEFAEAGVRHLIFASIPVPGDDRPPLRRYAEEVLPAFR